MPAAVAYYSGDDAYALGRAVDELAVALGGAAGPLERWRTSGDDDEQSGGSERTSGSNVAARRTVRILDEIEQRVGSAPLFGGGTLVVIRQPASLLRDGVTQARLLALVGTVPPGNGLVFVELTGGGSGRRPKAVEALREAVAAAGGAVREFPAPTRERMESWLAARASELGVRLGPGAGRLLAERVGGHVREGDVDRRRQTELANGELQKLALYRPDGTISRDDVAQLVPDVVPGSAWAFLDAVGARRTRQASDLAERLLADGTPLPVLISQIHRRIRELIVLEHHQSAGMRPLDLARTTRMQPFRLQKLAEQARAWTAADLQAALDGLVEVDLESKGIALDGGGRPMSPDRSALALQVWLAERVSRDPEITSRRGHSV